MAQSSRQVPASGSVSVTPSAVVEPRAGGGGGLDVSQRQIVAELQQGRPLKVMVSARAVYGSQGRRTSVSVPANNATPQQLATLEDLLTTIAQQEEQRLQNRLRYDLLLAHQAAIDAGEEPGPEA